MSINQFVSSGNDQPVPMEINLVGSDALSTLPGSSSARIKLKYTAKFTPPQLTTLVWSYSGTISIKDELNGSFVVVSPISNQAVTGFDNFTFTSPEVDKLSNGNPRKFTATVNITWTLKTTFTESSTTLPLST